MASDHDLDLTIGIELEFVFAADRSFWEIEAYEQPITCVSRLLQQHVGGPLGVVFRPSNIKHFSYDTNNTWTVHPEGGLTDESDNSHFEAFKARSATLKEVVAPEVSQLQHWNNLAGDSSLKRQAMEYITTHTGMMHEIEIVSPILHLSHLTNWIRVLERVEETLLTLPLSNPLTTNYTAWTPPKTGVHIHIALSQYSHLSFHTLQNLLAIWGCFEKQLNRLQPVHRHENDYCKSLWLFLAKGASYANFCRMMYSARDIPQLSIFTNPLIDNIIDSGDLDDPRYTRINLQTLTIAIDMVEDSDGDEEIETVQDAVVYNGAKLTVEFREHAGTLRAEDVRWWVLFVAAVVRFAESCDRQGVCWGVQGELDIEDLWEMVGFEEEGREFYRERMERLSMA
ncbi:MAG: hypothetical protein M1835_004185 [Candelina submexicana]|nr:MAG: hypothetical protein M1835_004185 [Candelina submexicana]